MSENSVKQKKLLILLLGAVVAIGGTIVASFVEAGIQKNVDKAQERLLYEQASLEDARAEIRFAVTTRNQAYILHGTMKNEWGGQDGKAKGIAYGAVSDLHFLVDTNEDPAGRMSRKASDPSNRNPCIGRFAALNLGSDVTQSEDLAHCYVLEVERDEVAQDKNVNRLRNTMRTTSLVATVLQLLGIGIAFLKDVVT